MRVNDISCSLGLIKLANRQLSQLMQKKQFDQEELNKAFEQFGNQTPLNLTNQDKKEEDPDDPELAAKMQAEYEKFMKQMKSGDFQEDNMDGLVDALGGLLKNLGESLGLQGKQGEQFKNFLGEKGESSNMEQLAGKLLEVFMKKDLLYEPLVESNKNYEEFFKKQEGKIAEQDLQRFKKQHEVIRQILRVLDETPEDKKKLMDLFEKMQDYGQPPAGIASVTLPEM